MSKCVDIIIPVYNTNPVLLRDCIDSVKAQTYSNLNIIVIDDGSDNRETKKTIQSFGETARIITQRNRGVSSARNRGLVESRGDFVFFLDSDDTIEKELIERLVTIAENGKYDVVFSGAKNESSGVIDMPFRDKEVNLHEDAGAILIKSYAFTLKGALIKSCIAKKEKFEIGCTSGEDTDYIVRVMREAKTYIDGRGGYNYRQSISSVMHRLSPSDYYGQARELLDKMKTILKPEKEAEEVFIMLKMMGLYAKLLSNSKHSEAVENMKQIAGGHIKTPSVKYIAMQPILTRGEKAGLILFKYKLYRLYHILICAKKR